MMTFSVSCDRISDVIVNTKYGPLRGNRVRQDYGLGRGQRSKARNMESLELYVSNSSVTRLYRLENYQNLSNYVWFHINSR